MIIIKVLKKLINEIRQLKFNFIITYPNSFIGYKLRNSYWSSRLKECGKKNTFAQFSTIGFPEIIEIGDDFILGNYAHMTAAGSSGIFIGNNVSITRGTYLHASNHVFQDLEKPIRDQGTIESKIKFNGKFYGVVIEDDVWIGSNAVILSGCHLKKGSIVSAGSVVSCAYPENAIIIGNPARLLKIRGTKLKI
jgi:acetyltransferase-like isoleucine patch superfamily enzyme